jgi:thiazole synthase
VTASDTFTIAGVELSSRLFLGTAGYPNQSVMVEAVEASECEIVTMSIRRISLDKRGSDTVNLLKNYRFLPNTAGCETARDAILTAELAREALDTNWIKVEVIGNRETLYPDISSTRALSFCPIAPTIR